MKNQNQKVTKLTVHDERGGQAVIIENAEGQLRTLGYGPTDHEGDARMNERWWKLQGYTGTLEVTDMDGFGGTYTVDLDDDRPDMAAWLEEETDVNQDDLDPSA